MRAVARAIACLTATVLVSCVPGVGVSGAREGSDIVLSISSCPWPWHDLPVDYISVFKEVNRDQMPECKLVSTNLGATVLRRWVNRKPKGGWRVERAMQQFARYRRDRITRSGWNRRLNWLSATTEIASS
jgi:hypothetical protein